MTIRENSPRCELGLTSMDLSTWRAQGCKPAMARRIAAHITTCAVCQEHLSAYDTLDSALRMQKVPMQTRIGWQVLVPFLNSRREHTTPPPFRTVRWHVLAAMAAILLVVGGFVGLLGHGLFNISSLPSQTSSQRLSWRAGNIPQAIAKWYINSSWHPLPVSQSDAATLYGCEVPVGNASPVIWVSHDRAVTWEHVGTLPITRRDINQCFLTVDKFSPSIAIAVVGWDVVKGAPGPQSGKGASYLTVNGGLSWQALTDPQYLSIAQLATRHGVTYAYFDSIYASERRLMVSTDQMRTWQRIDQPIVATSQHVWDFTLDPMSETIMATVGKDGDAKKQLWVTGDGGHAWKQLPAPPAETFAIRAPSAGHSWMICARHYDVTRAKTLPNEIFCSVDSGEHWQKQTALNGTAIVSVPMLNPSTGKSFIQLITIADDGALIALDPGPSTGVLYRLAVGANHWQSLGALPHAGTNIVIYSTQPGLGVLWALNATETDRMLFSADYP